MAKKRHIIFMGTPDFAVPALKKIAREHEVSHVYSQPPRRSGRGMKLMPSPVQQCAEELIAEGFDIKIHNPIKFDAESIGQITEIKPDFIIVIAYGIILPKAVLEAPKFAAINGHASLLPRWRGAAPIQRAIAAGDKETGAAAMMMEETLDTGAVLCEERTPISAEDTAQTLHDRLAVMMADVVCHAIDHFETLTPQPQDERLVTWADKITPKDGEIDFGQTSEEVSRHIRSISPKPGAWFIIKQNDRMSRIKVLSIKVWAGAIDHKAKGKAGEVLGVGQHGAPLIATKDGAIELVQMQPQGKPMMTGKDFLNGHQMPKKIEKYQG